MPAEFDLVRRFANILPEPTVLVRRDGEIVLVNRAFTTVFGWPSEDVAGRSLADLAETPAADLRQFIRHAAGTSQFLPGALSLRRRDGTPVDCRADAAAFRPGDAADDRLVAVRLTQRESAIAAFVELTDKIGGLSAEIVRRRKAERAAAAALDREQRVRERLTALTEASGSLVASPSLDQVLPGIGRLAERLIAADAHAVWRCDTATGEWRAVWRERLSASFVDAIAGWTGEAGAAVPAREPLLISEIDAVPLLADRRTTYAAEGIQALVVIPLQIGAGAFGTVVAYYRRPMVFSVDDRRVASALGSFASAALTMAGLYEAESANRSAAEGAERRSSFLARASAALASSLDYETTLKTVAQLAVPEVADWCAIDIGGGPGEIRRVAVAHGDPEKAEIARDIQDRYRDDPSVPYAPARVVSAAAPILIPQVTEDTIAAVAVDEDHRRMIRSLGLVSYMCVPLTANSRALGALTLASAESRRRYTDADLRLAKEVAWRAALAIENARAYEEVRDANRLKDEFLATLSHELRTPLNAVLGYARMLRAGILRSDRQARAVEVLERNATALTQIVEDILDVSRIIAGKIRLNVQPVDLGVVFHAAVATVLPAAEAKGVAIETHLDPGGAAVSADPDRLQQVAWNLLSNAVKFTPRGGRVQIRADVVESQVQITVADTGRGIPAEFLPHVFERFRQADSRFTREHGGLGLGLAIARHIVEMHGGTITAASEGDGKGATFTIRLPVLAARAKAPRQTGGHPGAARTEAADWKAGRLDGVHVLAVDNEPDALLLVAEILEAAGASVTAVASGAAALDQLAAGEPPDVLLTDIGMPGLDGFDLIARVRNADDPALRRVPAIALTAYARSEDRVRALERGYQRHLAKPVSPGELVAAIRTVVMKHNRIEPV